LPLTARIFSPQALRVHDRQENLARVYHALYDKDRQPSHLDAALEAVDGALEEYRKANALAFVLRSPEAAPDAGITRPAGRRDKTARR
jgi:hypothetical protein